MVLNQFFSDSFQERNFGFLLDEMTQQQFIDYIFGDDFDGHLCISIKNKNGKLWNVFYKKNELDRMYKYLEKVYGNDVYISYSTYYDGDKKRNGKRKQENILKTHMLVQDLDFYKFNITDAEFLQGLNKKVSDGDLLMPNILVSTGRGYQLITVVESFKNIEGYSNDRKWRKIQDHQINILEEFNSDTVVKNPSAVTRIPGSKHRKSGNKVYSFLAKPEKYTLDEVLKFYGLNHNEKKISKKRTANNKNTHKKVPRNDFYTSSKGIYRLFNEYTLNKARIDDIFAYVRIKNERKEGYIGIRNRLALILRFHSLIVNNGDVMAAERDVLKLISEMDMRDTTEEEILRRSLGSDKYYLEWVNATWNKERYIQGGLFYSNERLIELLGIQDDYELQTQLKTIKIRDKEYHKQRMRIKRKEQGLQSRGEYNKARQTNKEKAIQLKQQGKKQKEIAAALGVSLNTVKYYFRKK